MDSFDQHVLICDPQPSEEVLEGWRDVVGRMATSIMRVNSPHGLFEVSNDLERVTENRAVGCAELGAHVARILSSVDPERVRTDGQLCSWVCAMLAVRHVMAGSGGSKRGVMAVAMWSALSFRAPLAEPRLEALRKETLACARQKSLQVASEGRERPGPAEATMGRRSSSAVTRELSETKEALRRNADVDREEIAVLRWLLADESGRLGLPYVGIEQPETAVLAMGLELGHLLTTFPTVAHYRLGRRFVREPRSLDLCKLIEAVGDDRKHLAASYLDNPVVEACPSVFPLLTALARGRLDVGGARIERSLNEWWGRALLESAAAVLGAKKGWS